MSFDSIEDSNQESLEKLVNLIKNNLSVFFGVLQAAAIRNMESKVSDIE